MSSPMYIPQSFINDLLEKEQFHSVFEGSIVSIVGVSFEQDWQGGQGDRSSNPDVNRFLSSGSIQGFSLLFNPDSGTSRVASVSNQQGAKWNTFAGENEKWNISGSDKGFTISPNLHADQYLGWRGRYNYMDIISLNGPNLNDTFNKNDDECTWKIKSVNKRYKFNNIEYAGIRINGLNTDEIVIPNAYGGQFIAGDFVFNSDQHYRFSGASNALPSRIHWGRERPYFPVFPQTVQLIEVLHPSEALSKLYCKENATTKVCEKFCRDGSCDSALKVVCEGENLKEGVCINYCKSKNVHCDSVLQTYCEGLINDGTFSDLIKDRTFSNICGCFLPQSYYDNYITSVEEKIPIKLSGDIKNCYYPQCTTSEIHPFDWKNGPQNCPSNNSCINITNVDNSGSVQDVNINQEDSKCQSFIKKKGSGGSTEPVDPSPEEIAETSGDTTTSTSTPSASTSSASTPKEIKNKKENSKNITYGIIGGGILLVAVVMLVVYATRGNKSRDYGGRDYVRSGYRGEYRR